MIEWFMDQLGRIPCPKCGKYGKSPLRIYKFFACTRKGCETAVPNLDLGMRKYFAENE